MGFLCGFHKIKEDNKDNENTKEGIVIKDVRVSPYALKRKHLVELLITKEKVKDKDTNKIIEKTHFTTIKNISRLSRGSKYDKGMYYSKKCYCSFSSEEILNNKHIPLCTDVENVLTITPEKNKNDTVKFRDYHMQTMQPFMIIADFETYTDKLNQIKPYSFAMFTHCIFNENNNKLTHYTGRDCLDEFFNDLTYHVNRISQIKAKPNHYSNPDVYKTNAKKTICLICNNQILANNPHAYQYYSKKSGYLHGFRHGECKERKPQIIVLFHNGAKFDFRLIIEYLAHKCTHSDISCIAHSMQTFFNFSITNFNGTGINLRFTDSYKHITYPLDYLVNYLWNKDKNIQSIKTKFSSLFQILIIISTF